MSSRWAQACEADPRLAIACDGDARLAQACASTGCWVAGIVAIAGANYNPNDFYVPGDDESGADSDANEIAIEGGFDQDDCPNSFDPYGMAWATLRSASPSGTSISASLVLNLNGGGTYTVVVPLTVGGTAAWARGPSFTTTGTSPYTGLPVTVTIQTWIAMKQLPAGTISATPAAPVIIDNPPFCEWTDEWAVYFDTISHSCDGSLYPFSFSDTALFADEADWANTLCGMTTGTPCADYYGVSLNPSGSTGAPGSGQGSSGHVSGTPGGSQRNSYVGVFFGAALGSQIYKISDPPTVVEPTGFNTLNVDLNGDAADFPDVPSGSNVEHIASYNRVAFTPPTGPLTPDNAFDLEVTNWNPYTGNAVDGTHGNCDGQVEADTMPYVLLDGGDPDVCFEGIDIISGGSGVPPGNPTRIGFGDYKWTGLHFFCRAGMRSFSCAPYHQQPGGSPLAGKYVTSVPVSSGLIQINPGAPFCLDTPQGFQWNAVAGCPLYWFRINQPILVGGQPIEGRILDQVGNQCPFNVCTGDNTDTIQLDLYDDTGATAWTSPTINGTIVQPAVAGIAAFPGISITGLGPGSATPNTCINNYLLCPDFSPTSPALVCAANVNGCCVGIGLTAGLAFNGGPTLTVAHGVPVTIEVDLVDYGGSTISPATADPVTLGAGGSGFTGAGAVTPTAGVALFSGTFPTPGVYTLPASTAGTNYYGPGSPAPGQTDPAITITVTVT